MKTVVLKDVTINTPADWHGSKFGFTVSRPEPELSETKIYIGAHYRELGDVVNSLVGEQADLKVAPHDWELGNKSGIMMYLVEVSRASG